MMVIENPRACAKITADSGNWLTDPPEWLLILGMIITGSLSILSFAFMFWALAQ